MYLDLAHKSVLGTPVAASVFCCLSGFRHDLSELRLAPFSQSHASTHGAPRAVEFYPPPQPGAGNHTSRIDTHAGSGRSITDRSTKTRAGFEDRGEVRREPGEMPNPAANSHIARANDGS